MRTEKELLAVYDATPDNVAFGLAYAEIEILEGALRRRVKRDTEAVQYLETDPDLTPTK